MGHSRTAVDLLLAVIWAGASRFDEAEPVLRRALAQSAEPQPEVAEALAKIYLATFRLSHAAGAIARWMCDAPADPRPYLYRNEIDDRTGAGPDRLIANDREALRRDPCCDDARIDLAERLRLAGRFAEAIPEFDAFLARRPDASQGHLGAGRCAWGVGDVEAAARHFDHCLTLQPRDADALAERALIDLYLGDRSTALGRLKKAAEIDPYNPEIHARLAQALWLCGDVESAKSEDASAHELREQHARMRQIRNALVERPGDPDLRCEATRWMLEHGRDDEGLRLADQVIKDRPGHVTTHRLLAEYHLRKGNAGLANYHKLRVAASSQPVSVPGQEGAR